MLFIGCSMDVGEVLEHPKQVAPSAQFEVSMLDQYLMILNGSTVSGSVVRDSIHLAVGLPAGYSVVAAKYYFPNNLKPLKMASAMDSVAAIQAIKDSASVYKSRASAMQSTPQFVGILKHRSYSAANPNDTVSITVNTDSVKNWSAWGGTVNITIPAGAAADTMVDTMGMTLGIISRPVFVWITLMSKNIAGPDTLYYFSKTAAMPALSDTANVDKGQITYVPLIVTNSGIRFADQSKKDSRAVSVFSYPGGDKVVINFPARYKEATGLEVFAVSGMKVADLSSALSGSNGSFTWSIKNSRVQPGLYFVRLKSREGIISTPLRILK